MSFDCVNNVSSFWQTSDSEVVAATWDGLYSLTTAGTLSYKICGGCFTDVCLSYDNLVAIEMNKSEVQVFKGNHGKWVLQHVFTVSNAENNQDPKHICAQGDVVYISDNCNEKIYKYSLTGECLQQFGSTRGNSLGQLNGPYVSGTDCHHSLIVCDSNNHCIQVKKSDGEWTQYTLPGGIRNVLDVLVMKHSLYLLWDNEHGLMLSTFRINL